MRIFSLFTYLQDEVDADVVPEDAQFENGIITPGILNIGNTCYISAAVQLLLSIPQFIFKLSNWYEKLSPKRDLPLTKALLKIALTMGVLKQENVPQSKPPCPEAADPSALKKLMGKLKENEYNGNNQEDSHEFLRDLIGCLHEELDGGDKELIDDIEPPTDEFFRTDVTLCVKCNENECQGLSKSKDTYQDFSVSVPLDTDDGQSWSVERAIEELFQEEVHEIDCNSCKQKKSPSTCTKKISRR